MLRQSHLWSLTLSLGLLTAVSIASGTLALGKTNANNDKKRESEVLEDTDTEESFDSSYDDEGENDDEDVSVQLHTLWEKSDRTMHVFHLSERLEI